MQCDDIVIQSTIRKKKNKSMKPQYLSRNLEIVQNNVKSSSVIFQIKSNVLQLEEGKVCFLLIQMISKL